jgi:hypothetical protein
MDPQELKDYQHAYVPSPYPYPSDLPPMYSGEYQTMGGMQMGAGAGVMNPYMTPPPPQSVYQPPQTPPPEAAVGVKQKGKRRSKNDTEGRNFKCKQCERTYLSYPALYTHIKTKHASTTEPPATTGRGRGRPKKAVAPSLLLFIRL